jgi:hypothetical protein
MLKMAEALYAEAGRCILAFSSETKTEVPRGRWNEVEVSYRGKSQEKFS